MTHDQLARIKAARARNAEAMAREHEARATQAREEKERLEQNHEHVMMIEATTLALTMPGRPLPRRTVSTLRAIRARHEQLMKEKETR